MADPSEVDARITRIREKAAVIFEDPEKADRWMRRALARMVTTLFDHWALDDNESLAMLGMTKAAHPWLTRYRKGEPLSTNRDMLDRAGHLLAIHKSLRLMFPHERDRAYRWIRTRNRAFDQRTPAEMITEYGFPGLLMVRTYLDRARAH